jgi:LacI family transcriptional regulator
MRRPKRSQQPSVTIRDVAQRAGVSPSTVSRVLNDSTPVAADKHAAVLAAVRALGYRPNVLAQELARGRSRAIGVLAPGLSIPFWSQLVRGVEQGLRDSEYYPLFASGEGISEATQALDLLLSHRVDALIVLGGDLADDDLRRLAERMPILAVGRSIAGLEARSMHVENREGAREAVRHLLGLGHMRIAHITGMAWHPDAVARREGYEQGLREAGVAVDARLNVEGSFDERSGLVAIETLIARSLRFSAVFAGNDQMAYGAGLALFRRGLRVPDDVSIVGFDDQPAAAYTWPPLTTVRQPAVKMGDAAVKALLNQLRGAAFQLPSFATELVVRESTGPVAPERR